MPVKLPFGRDEIELHVPKGIEADVLEPPELTGPPLSAHDVREKISSEALGERSLADTLRGRNDACFAVPDSTRPFPLPMVLPILLDEAEKAGIESQRRLVLVATGLHSPPSTREIAALMENDVGERCRPEAHDAKDADQHAYVGDTSLGSPVYIDRRYLEASAKIVLGLVEPHFMAGFSGGPKTVCPGLASADTIAGIHSPELMVSPQATEGRLRGNPVHEEIWEAAQLAGVEFCINVVVDHRSGVRGLWCGDLESVFTSAVKAARAASEVTAGRDYDVVVTTGGGAPLDASFHQTVKGMWAARNLVRPGGVILAVSSCSGGLGSVEFSETLHRAGDLASLKNLLAAGELPIVDSWQVLRLLMVMEKAEVWLVSRGLADKGVEQFPVRSYVDLTSALSDLVSELGSKQRWAVLPRGPYTLPTTSFP